MKLVHGTKAIGSMCGAAKMTEFGVIAARSAYRLRWHTQSELAAFFGVSRATIGDMISNRTWRHVT